MRYRIFLIVFLFTLLLEGRSFALTKAGYYRSLLRDYGIPVVFSLENEAKFEGREEKELNLSGSSPYLVLFSSEYSEQELAGSNKVIVLCDVPLSIEGYFYCNLYDVGGSEGSKVKVYDDVSNNLDVNVYELVINNRKIVVVPEMNLISSFKREEMREYFRALVRSDKVECSSCGEEDEGITLGSEIIEFFRSSLGRVVAYFAAVVFITLISVYMRSLISIRKRTFTSSMVEKTAGLFTEFYRKSSWLSIYLAAVMSIFYIPLILTISFKDKGFFSLKYIISFTINSFNPEILNQDLLGGGFFRTFYLFYILGLGVLVFFLILPTLAGVIKRANSLVFDQVISMRSAVRTLSIVFVALLALLIVYRLEDIYAYVSFLLLVLLYVYYLVESQGARTSAVFGKKVSILLAGIYILALSVGYLFREDIENVVYRYDYEYKDLIGISDSVVMLPYDKSHSKEVLFDDFYLMSGFPVFVDDYLVYHPEYGKIRNLDISDFKEEGSFLIVKGSEDELTQFFIDNKDVRKYLTGSLFSRVFYVENFAHSPGSNYAVGITFECSTRYEKKSLSFVSHSSGDKDEVKLVNYPGCTFDWERNVRYEVPVQDKLFKDGLMAFYIHGSNAGLVKDIDIIKDGNVMSLNYIMYPEEEGIAAWKRGPSEVLNAYSFDLEKEYCVDEPLTKSGVNISNIINNMKLKGLISDPFRIWTSSSGNRIIRSNL